MAKQKTKEIKRIKPKKFGLNVKKIKSAGYTHMICSRSDDELPLSEFRIYSHRKEYLSYCKEVEMDYAKNGYPTTGNVDDKESKKSFQEFVDSNSSKDKDNIISKKKDIKTVSHKDGGSSFLSRLRTSTKNNQ